MVIYENGVSIQAVDYKAGTPQARVLVRATLYTGDYASSITSGFDLTPKVALQLAELLTKTARELLAAEVAA